MTSGTRPKKPGGDLDFEIGVAEGHGHTGGEGEPVEVLKGKICLLGGDKKNNGRILNRYPQK